MYRAPCTCLMLMKSAKLSKLSSYRATWIIHNISLGPQFVIVSHQNFRVALIHSSDSNWPVYFTEVGVWARLWSLIYISKGLEVEWRWRWCQGNELSLELFSHYTSSGPGWKGPPRSCIRTGEKRDLSLASEKI